MTTHSITQTTQDAIAQRRAAVAAAGEAANRAAAAGVFEDYRGRRATNTLRAQDGDLRLFRATMADTFGVRFDDDLPSDPAAWTGMTWGLLDAFKKALLTQGYALSTVNHALSTVKTYCKLAFRAGVLDDETHAKIRTVTGYSKKEAENVNATREQARQTNAKKAEHTKLTDAQAEALKDQPDTAQGLRDRLLMSLLLDMGLRCGEAAALTVGAVDLDAGTLRFYRAKVKLVQTHDLPAATLDALRRWFSAGHAPPLRDAPLLRASRKGGRLTAAGMSERAITKRVRYLGEQIGIQGLSAHDCRHYWATYWANRVHKLPKGVLSLQEAGGWSSLAMPRHYVENARIANEGMA